MMIAGNFSAVRGDAGYMELFMDKAFTYAFPAIRGIQANREYYVSMCPLRLIPRIFSFDEEELSPEMRAQRVLNKNRIPEMSRYIVQNRNDYTFSALTASVDAEVFFEPFEGQDEDTRLGILKIPMDARFIINDGQHRRAAIEMALHEDPKLADETIAVVFFMDVGLERCQQMFADLNRYAIRPSTSLGMLYDHRDHLALLAKRVVFASPVFRDVVEMERSTLSARSRKLFTLSAIHSANKAFVQGREGGTLDEVTDQCVEFWEHVALQFPEWQQVREGKMSSATVRKDYIHSHALVLQALGRAGNALLKTAPKRWKKRLEALRKLDWRKANAETWEGRAMTGGRVTKAAQNVTLTTNVIKKVLNLPLAPEEQRTEDALKRGEHGRRKKK